MSFLSVSSQERIQKIKSLIYTMLLVTLERLTYKTSRPHNALTLKKVLNNSKVYQFSMTISMELLL